LPAHTFDVALGIGVIGFERIVLHVDARQGADEFLCLGLFGIVVAEESRGQAQEIGVQGHRHRLAGLVGERGELRQIEPTFRFREGSARQEQGSESEYDTGVHERFSSGSAGGGP
jgi:hypothetical protein